MYTYVRMIAGPGSLGLPDPFMGQLYLQMKKDWIEKLVITDNLSICLTGCPLVTEESWRSESAVLALLWQRRNWDSAQEFCPEADARKLQEIDKHATVLFEFNHLSHLAHCEHLHALAAWPESFCWQPWSCAHLGLDLRWRQRQPWLLPLAAAEWALCLHLLRGWLPPCQCGGAHGSRHPCWKRRHGSEKIKRLITFQLMNDSRFH